MESSPSPGPPCEGFEREPWLGIAAVSRQKLVPAPTASLATTESMARAGMASLLMSRRMMESASGMRLDALLSSKAAPKLGLTSTRSVPASETERRIRPLLPLVPITRISDIAPLDPLGFPVCVVTTPLARDLTTHAGKGNDAESARVSALMEALERVSAESISAEATVHASHRELCDAGQTSLVDPVLFELPSDSSYRADLPISWVQSHDILRDRKVWLPSDLALSPAREGVLREVDTNGLASGNTLLEAVLHALCEVIERDAFSQLEFTTLFGAGHEVYPPLRSVELSTLPETARFWAERIAAQHLNLIVQVLDTDIGVPTFRSVLIDSAYPTPHGPTVSYFPGFGVHPNKEVALLRSLTEALQSRVGFIHGGRDSFNTFSTGVRRAAKRARQRLLFQSPRVSYQELASFCTREQTEDMSFLLARLEAIGIERVIVTELTRSNWGVPVVRVRVPGLSCFLVNRRRVDLRCLRHLV